MVRVTAVHMVGGVRHEHIASVQWINPQTQVTGQSTREEMVQYLTQNPAEAYVSDGTRNVTVGVVDATKKYIRTHADGVWTDNLLALPRY
jgi:hypothetical protein